MKTPTIIFYPNHQNKSIRTGKTPIYLRIILNGKKVEGKTTLALNDSEVKRWLLDYTNHNSSLNKSLLPYRTRSESFLDKCRINNLRLNPKVLRDHILEKEQLRSDNSVKEYVLAYMQAKVNSDNNKEEGTKLNYLKGFNHFLRFLDLQEISNITFDELDSNFGARFGEYLMDSKNHKRKLSEAYANGLVKKIKTLFKQARKDNKTQIDIFDGFINYSPRSPKKSELHISQVKAIIDLELLRDSPMYHFRNLFLGQIFTGLAFVDISQLEWSHITKTNSNRLLLQKKRGKTDILIRQILPKQMEAILELYPNSSGKENERIFPSISLSKYNVNLKSIATFAKIQINISSHIARHTYCQQLQEAEINDEKTEYSMVGWSRRGYIDEIYSTVPEVKLLSACKKLEEYLTSKLE